jgi:uncharacterized protein HemX
MSNREGDPVTASATPPDEEVRGQPSTANATTNGKKKRPILWMVISGVAVLVAIGLGVWAVTVHSDLQDQKAATQAAEAHQRKQRGARRLERGCRGSPSGG